MSKTKFRSLGMGFLLAALILALVTVIWPFVPQSLKSRTQRRRSDNVRCKILCCRLFY